MENNKLACVLRNIETHFDYPENINKTRTFRSMNTYAVRLDEPFDTAAKVNTSVQWQAGSQPGKPHKFNTERTYYYF